MRLALSLSAVTLVGGLVVPVLTLAGTARADVHPADQAQETLTVTKRDATGDVHLDRSGRRAPHRVTGSVDLSAARYRIDRTEETLTVTYPVRRILARGSDYTQFFASIATVDKAQDDAVASAVFITSPLRGLAAESTRAPWSDSASVVVKKKLTAIMCAGL